MVKGKLAQGALGEVISQAEAAYGLCVHETTPVASVYRPEAVYRLQSDHGPLCLKPFRYAERQLKAVLAGLDHVNERGFTRLAPIVPTRDGRRYLSVGGKLYLVSRWIAGDPCRFEQPEHVRAAADSLGAFHVAALGCAGAHARRPGSWPTRYRRQAEDLAEMAAIAARQPRSRGESSEWEAQFDRLFTRYSPYFIAEARDAAANIDCLAYRRLRERSVAQGEHCHRDYVAPNLVIDRTGQAVLLDLDTWGPDLRLYDLAKLVSNASHWHLERALLVLEGYEQHLMLSSEERVLLPWAVMMPREFWWAGTCRYRRGVCTPAVLDLLELAVRSVAPKADFLRALRGHLADH